MELGYYYNMFGAGIWGLQVWTKDRRLSDWDYISCMPGEDLCLLQE